MKRPGYDDEELFCPRPQPPLLKKERVNRTVKVIIQQLQKQKLTGCNEGEEKNFWPDDAYDGGLEFFASDSTSKNGIVGHHYVKRKRKRKEKDKFGIEVCKKNEGGGL